MNNIFEFIKDKNMYGQITCISLFLFYLTGLFSFYVLDFKIVFLFVLLISIFLVLILFFKKFGNLYSPLFPSILFLFFISGFLIAKINSVQFDSFSNIDYLKDVELTGYVDNIPQFSSKKNSYKFPFKVINAKYEDINYEVINTTVLANVIKSDDINLSVGDKVKLRGILTLPNTSKNPGQFNYREFLKRKGILKTFYVNNYIPIIIKTPSIADIKESKLKDKIYLIKNYIVRVLNDLRQSSINKHSGYIKSPNLEILGGIVFGDDAVNPPDNIKDSFINSGLLHLLSASGLNVALILSLWFFVIYFLNIPYRLKIASGVLIVFIYALMTGFPPSIVRASVMLCLILFGKLIYRSADNISLIFAAGLLILIFKPVYAVDVGFQLSFLVTLGLIICVPCVNYILKPYDKKYLKKIKDYPKIIKTILLFFIPTSLACIFFVPLIAQLWAGPLQAYYFNTFSTYSLFANVMVVPFIGIISFLGFIGSFIAFIPYINNFILPFVDLVLNFLIQILLNISNYFSQLSYSIIKVKSPDIFFIILFYIFVIFLFISLKYLFKKKILNILTLVFFILSFFFLVDFKNYNSEVIFFSVGNADNILIKTKDNKFIMIDTGRFVYNGYSTAKTVTLEYLYDNNIKKLDTLIVTHYDSDHSGGLIDILNEIKVDNLIIPKLECSSLSNCTIKEYIEKNNIKYSLPLNFQTIEYNGVKITNFVPNINSKSRNDSSTVSLVDFGEYKFLFSADVSKYALNSIINYLPKNIYLLKAAHHGADDTVDEFLIKYLNPEISLLSTGKNPYGHPSLKTLDILDDYSKVLSTDNLGAIKFVITNDRVKIFRYDGNKRKFLRI